MLGFLECHPQLVDAILHGDREIVLGVRRLPRRGALRLELVLELARLHRIDDEPDERLRIRNDATGA